MPAPLRRPSPHSSLSPRLGRDAEGIGHREGHEARHTFPGPRADRGGLTVTRGAPGVSLPPRLSQGGLRGSPTDQRSPLPRGGQNTFRFARGVLADDLGLLLGGGPYPRRLPLDVRQPGKGGFQFRHALRGT
ncbi:hypothetical protein, partial [Streptomyces tricolor]